MRLTYGPKKNGHPIYMVWAQIVQRCCNPKDKRYYRYKGMLCQRWRDSFSAFLSDVGPRPEGTSIDRIDNERGYEPGNVRWATRQQQQRNIRTNRYLEHEGRKLLICEWSEVTGLTDATICTRLARGWTAAQALSPVCKSRWDSSRRTK